MDEQKEFQRTALDSRSRWTWIGTGRIGGKASGLVAIDEILAAEFPAGSSPQMEVGIPAFTVVRTDVFDAFIERNHLRAIAGADHPDDVIAQEFQKASLPTEVLGDVRALIARVHTPLAVRSSSLLEDSMQEPFAGIYATKMIPNNQSSTDVRFQKVVEAIKLVYASAFFKAAREYIRATGRRPEEEKMAVVLQETVGSKYGDRFYPQVSGVARSFNFYPAGHTRREEGVVSLALGLGKTIVDGGICWTYSPAKPLAPLPFNSVHDVLQETQTQFWAVNLGKPPAYDPIRETEYLSCLPLDEAEKDETLRLIASTYDVQAERIVPGTAVSGPRVLNFAGLLGWKDIPLNDTIRRILKVCRSAIGYPVEIEFAVTFNPNRLGFLQVRPMVVSEEEIALGEDELRGPHVLIASERVLGNGINTGIRDVLYVKPDRFEPRFTRKIAEELEVINRMLHEQKRPYVLIGFGRWGSSDPSLGIPVTWGQVSGAKVIVESTLPAMNVELSQGSHFFHNLTSFNVSYFCVLHTDQDAINWDWLEAQEIETDSGFVRHVVLPVPLEVKVDGRSGLGVIRSTIPEHLQR